MNQPGKRCEPILEEQLRSGRIANANRDSLRAPYRPIAGESFAIVRVANTPKEEWSPGRPAQ